MLRRTKIAVFVSGGGTNLQALIDAERSGKLPDGELALVLSSRADAFALERAAQAGIPSAVPTDETEIQALLARYGVELIILAGYLRILSADFTARWAGRILNVHPSLIPAFCGRGYYGLRVHEAALARGVKVTGATVHFVNEIPDGGEILLQKPVAVLPGDTPETLQRRVMEQAEWVLLPEAAETVAAKLAKEREENGRTDGA